MGKFFYGWIFFRGEYFSEVNIFQWWIFCSESCFALPPPAARQCSPSAWSRHRMCLSYLSIPGRGHSSTCTVSGEEEMNHFWSVYVTLVKSRCYICYICRFGVTKAEPAEDDTVLQGFRISLVLRPLPNYDLGQSRFRFGGKQISNDLEITRSARSFVKDIYILLGETHSDPFLDTSLLSRVSVDQRLKQKWFSSTFNWSTHRARHVANKMFTSPFCGCHHPTWWETLSWSGGTVYLCGSER